MDTNHKHFHAQLSAKIQLSVFRHVNFGLRTGVTKLVFVDARGMVTANITVSVCERSAVACATRDFSS